MEEPFLVGLGIFGLAIFRHYAKMLGGKEERKD